MRRFWKSVEARAVAEEGWEILLDGRPVRTPARAALLLPTETLAQAIATEWSAVEERIDPRAMPMTGLANAAIDRVAPDPQAFAAVLARYGESDLLCYRADAPRELAARQAERWDDLLGWARRRYDVDFATVCGVMHVPQQEATVQRLAHALATLDPFRLTALSPLVTLGGSLVAGLAVLERAVPAETAWDIVTIDDQWQAAQWGRDADAEKALEERRRDFLAAAQFLDLVGSA